jgi:hypothetical protein
MRWVRYKDARIYHYGSYDLRAIKTLDKRYETDKQTLIDRLVNVNKQIYGKMYFPVYYQDKSFFRFLFSEETDLDNFKPRKRKQNKS